MIDVTAGPAGPTITLSAAREVSRGHQESDCGVGILRLRGNDAFAAPRVDYPNSVERAGRAAQDICVFTALSSKRFRNLQKGCPGASVEGTKILTRVLEATLLNPSRSSPGATLMDGLTHPRMSASTGNPAQFSLARRTRTECSWPNRHRTGPFYLAADNSRA